MATMSPGSRRTRLRRSGPTNGWLGDVTRAGISEGELPQVGPASRAPNTPAPRSVTTIHLDVGLPVAGADVERMIGAARDAGGKANQSRQGGPETTTVGAPIPPVDQGEGGAGFGVAPEGDRVVAESEGRADR